MIVVFLQTGLVLVHEEVVSGVNVLEGLERLVVLGVGAFEFFKVFFEFCLPYVIPTLFAEQLPFFLCYVYVS